MIFHWDEWNQGKLGKHAVSVDEARFVVENARRPYPMLTNGDKWLVVGGSSRGRMLQVVFVFVQPDRVDIAQLAPHERFELLDKNAEAVYVIHAMDLTSRIRRMGRRRKRKKP